MSPAGLEAGALDRCASALTTRPTWASNDGLYLIENSYLELWDKYPSHLFVSVVLPELTVYSQGDILFLNVKRVTCKYVAAYTKKF